MLVYAYGHPAFEGSRPAFADRMLRMFHEDVNQAGRVAMRSVHEFDLYRSLRHVTAEVTGLQKTMASR